MYLLYSKTLSFLKNEIFFVIWISLLFEYLINHTSIVTAYIYYMLWRLYLIWIIICIVYKFLNNKENIILSSKRTLALSDITNRLPLIERILTFTRKLTEKLCPTSKILLNKRTVHVWFWYQLLREWFPTLHFFSVYIHWFKRLSGLETQRIRGQDIGFLKWYF